MFKFECLFQYVCKWFCADICKEEEGCDLLYFSEIPLCTHSKIVIVDEIESIKEI